MALASLIPPLFVSLRSCPRGRVRPPEKGATRVRCCGNGLRGGSPRVRTRGITAVAMVTAGDDYILADAPPPAMGYLGVCRRVTKQRR